MVTKRPSGDISVAAGELIFGKLCAGCGTIAGTKSQRSRQSRRYRQRGPRSGHSFSALESENNRRALRVELSGAR
jgi:hypothetical protein